MATSTELLAEQVEASALHYSKKMILLALIELGVWTSDACQHPACQLEGQPVLLNTGRAVAAQAQVDHIVWRSRGGSNRPSNLRVVHRRCNVPLWDSTMRSGNAESWSTRSSLSAECEHCHKTFRGAQGLGQHQKMSIACSTDPAATAKRLSALSARNHDAEFVDNVRAGVKNWHAARGTAITAQPGTCPCGTSIPPKRKFCSRICANRRVALQSAAKEAT